MSETAEKLKPMLLALPAEERHELADMLWDSLTVADDAGLFVELERRRTEYEAGRRPAIPGDEFLRRLREAGT